MGSLHVECFTTIIHEGITLSLLNTLDEIMSYTSWIIVCRHSIQPQHSAGKADSRYSIKLFTFCEMYFSVPINAAMDSNAEGH